VPTIYPQNIDPYYAIAADGASVVFKGQVYHYYNESKSDLRWVIRLTTSKDGEVFTQQNFYFGPGTPGTFDDLDVADPYVVNVRGKLYMFYEGTNKTTGKQLTGVATSTDGINWERSSSEVLPQGSGDDFDVAAQGEPAVVYAGKYWYMLYVGNRNDGSRGIGWASSTDGLHWKKQSQDLFSTSERQPWFSRMMIDPTIWPSGNNDGTYYVWFGGGTAPGNQDIHGQIGRFTVKLN
jgi:predicted GH43/DUF377 family glycosyl hydrolase